jgi:hypothetical protein
MRASTYHQAPSLFAIAQCPQLVEVMRQLDAKQHDFGAQSAPVDAGVNFARCGRRSIAIAVQSD